MPQVVITKPAFLAWLQVRLNMFVKGWDVVSFFFWGFGELLLVTTCAGQDKDFISVLKEADIETANQVAELQRFCAPKSTSSVGNSD